MSPFRSSICGEKAWRGAASPPAKNSPMCQEMAQFWKQMSLCRGRELEQGLRKVLPLSSASLRTPAPRRESKKSSALRSEVLRIVMASLSHMGPGEKRVQWKVSSQRLETEWACRLSQRLQEQLPFAVFILGFASQWVTRLRK